MSLRLVRAPEPYERLDGDGPSLFLAGGITGIEDWQSRAEILAGRAGFPVTVFNPRRAGFDMTREADSVEQIAWEHRLLRAADLVLFWFAEGPSTQPITLFELGSAAERPGRIAVGVHPSYSRAMDVRQQLRHVRPEVEVRSTLEEVVAEALRALRDG
ncbi:nucleoside 2-deoxyribosyltransferase domain-containing protein [Phytomonospora sp. NPDC050363]|uniref:nucleoside 2-deoxyribosyltransferase domain-containing protein n=1 Tax=Phytomonospora sp. NPDC050363 TaxID=3155642 RepID=UPI0033CBDA5D